MTRGRVAGLAVLVLGLLGWWLFRGGPGGSGPSSPTGRTTPTVSPDETLASAPAVPGPARRGDAPEGRAAPASGPGEEEKPEVRWVDGVCVLEDGTPLPGIPIAARNAVNETNGSPASVTDAEGAFRIQATSDPVSIPYQAAMLVAAEGADILPSANSWSIPRIRVTGTRIRLTFRDRPGTAYVRLVNADSGEPVTKVKGLKVLWHVPGGWLSIGYTEELAPGGWIPILEGRLPETGQGDDQAGISADISKVEVEFAMPGFEKGRLPLADIKGRIDLKVRPVPADATGTVVVPRTGKAIADLYAPRVSATVRWTGPDPAPEKIEVLGMPTEGGPFSLYNLPDGSWDMEIAATLPDNTVVRGRKAFEKHGSTVDLGTIELVPAGRVVIRVIDSAGDPIPQAWAVIERSEENADQGRRLDLNEKGMVSVGDLEPGIGHRAVVKGLPRDLEQTVVAAADAKPVEFRWTEKLVPCRITLIVDGKAVANPDGRTTIPAVVQDSPMPRDKGAWKADGTFEAKLVPGTYKFSALATPKEGGDLALFSGEVTVPSGDSFEVRLELQRGGR